MSKWTKTTLGKIADIITGPFGSQLHQSDYVKRGIPIVMPQDIGNRNINYSTINYVSEEDATRLKRYSTVTNDILYARRGDVEKHAFVRAKDAGVLCGTGCLRVRINSNEVESAFLSFYLNREETRKWLVTHAVGTNMPNLNTDILSDVPIAYPTLKEQRKIVKVLNCLEERIVLNEKINDNLEQQAYLIFENMMAKAEAHRLKGKYTEAKFLASVITGKEDANFSVPNGKYKFFTCSNKPLYCNSYAFHTSSILIAGNGDFNVKHYSGKFNAYQRTYVLTPKKEYFALLYLASLYRINSFKSSSSGSIVKFITKSDVENIPVFIPDDTAYLDELNKLLLAQEQNTLENELLVQLRDWLLPMLMNGQATISD